MYLALTLDHLSVFPPVGEDEPWIAAAPYKLATEGVYGSDLFAGYYGVDRHNYQHMPLYPLLQAALFKTIGVGVFQMRLLPVLFGLALLAVVFLVGSRVSGARVGALAVALMLGLRLSADATATGILLLDRARINRYDIAVPVFGLMAFVVFLRAQQTGARRSYVLTGILTGLASLSHLFGIFWVPVFIALSLVRPKRSFPRFHLAAALLGGFALTWIPWLAYIASGWTDFLGQMRLVSSRFAIFDPSFYVSNLLHGGGPISVDWMWQSVRELSLTRPGAWSVVVGLPLAVSVLLWTPTRGDARKEHAWLLGIASVAQFVMFLTLLQVKTINYMIGLWPFAVVLLAWFGIWLWDRRHAAVRIALLALLVMVLVEGTTGIVRARGAARHTESYDQYTAEIARCIPRGSLVLGLQHYWLGLRQYEYRTWLMAVNYSLPRYYHDPVPLDAALERIDPDIILIDRYMARFFEDAARPDDPFHHMRLQFDTFMARRGAESICAIRSRTYGTMRVYRVPEPTTP